PHSDRDQQQGIEHTILPLLANGQVYPRQGPQGGSPKAQERKDARVQSTELRVGEGCASLCHCPLLCCRTEGVECACRSAEEHLSRTTIVPPGGGVYEQSLEKCHSSRRSRLHAGRSSELGDDAYHQ